MTALLLPEWLPAKYFDWTSLSQSVLAISMIALISMLVLFFLRPSPRSAAGLGILLMLFGLMHFGVSQKSLLVFCSSALLMCLYAILQESWRMAYLDELTGLPGRRALRERFQKLGATYTIAMLDVDHFKKFNDTYGHEVGDSVLRMIAGKLKAVTGGGSSFRYGGEEFTVIFQNRELPEAKEHLESLRETIAQSLFVVNRASRRSGDNASRPKKKKSTTVTVSIGIAQSDEQVNSPWDILKKADKALYRAKKKGRNCISR
jgi:diguanylate cyclase (GGDEF)-like protein